MCAIFGATHGLFGKKMGGSTTPGLAIVDYDTSGQNRRRTYKPP